MREISYLFNKKILKCNIIFILSKHQIIYINMFFISFILFILHNKYKYNIF